MDSIAYVGMDVHKNSHTVCVYFPESDEIIRKVKLYANCNELLLFNKSLTEDFPSTKFIYGYEAGCLGYSLFYYLQDYGIECKILAPHTVQNFSNRKVKTDKRDCENIAKTLAFNLGKYVWVPDESDVEVKEMLRMRNTHKKHFKKLKQQIQAFLLRIGKRYDEKNPWTQKHMRWLRNLDLSDSYRTTLDEYLSSYNYLDEKLDRLDREIEKISEREVYAEKVNILKCLKGVETHTALSVIVEIGDFSRFEKAGQFASYVGLVPGEASSGDKVNRTSITCAGNSRVRTLLTEAAQCHSRANPTYKSKKLKKRQEKCLPEVVQEADKINEYLTKRFRKLSNKGITRNKVVTAIARSLACSIWSMLKNV